MPPFNYPSVREGGADPREMARVVNRLNSGKINCTTNITLTSGTVSTVLSYPIITSESFIDFQPLTANAEVEWASGSMFCGSQTNESATITHANAGSGDRSFRVLIIG